MIDITVPIIVRSLANLREHWTARTGRAKAQRSTTLLCLRRHKMIPPAPPLRITLTRIGGRRMDTDNLSISCKHARDGVADWLGVDDGDERLEWVYAQAPGRPRCLRVQVDAR